MDAVLVYVGKAPDVTRGGRIDMNDLVARAARRGLDVYVYAFDAKGATQCDPVAPDAVEAALAALGADKAGAVYVGDSEVDAATAENAGLPLISVSWGFRSRDALRAAGARIIVDTPEELLGLCL